MIRRALPAALLLSACTTAPMTATPDASSPEREAVLATVDKFLLALGNHDDAAVEELLIVEGVSYAQVFGEGESGLVQAYTNASIIEPADEADPFIERYWSPQVQIRKGFAHVWAPYQVYDNGQPLHCGIDAFDLVYLDGAWRIASLMSTIEPDGCTNLPANPSELRPRDGWKETRSE